MSDHGEEPAQAAEPAPAEPPAPAEHPTEAFFDNDDLNGDCFIAGELGEVEELQLHRMVWFGDDTPKARAPFEKTSWDDDVATEFVNNNFYLLKDAVQGINDADAAKISYIRLLAARNGLVSPLFDPANYNVKYNEAFVDEDQTFTWLGDNPEDDHPTSVHQAIRGVLNKKVRNELREWFTDIAGCVAYMFRVRGHHWVEDMDDKYKDLWKKCLKTGDGPGVKWEYLAHHALHAVMPVVLDDFWTRSVQASNIAGALMKRHDAAPAGVAGLKALDAGMTDLATNVPGIKVHFRELYEAKDQLVERLKRERWAGSINRRFYGAGALGFDEGRFAAMAATILAALNQLVPTSPLRNSAALKRMAQGAPLTGALMVKMIVAAAEDPDNSRALVVAQRSA